jgi:hypothetical protein
MRKSFTSSPEALLRVAEDLSSQHDVKTFAILDKHQALRSFEK